MNLIQLVESLEKIKNDLPQGRRNSASRQPSDSTSTLPWVFNLSIYPEDFGIASFPNSMNQFLKINLYECMCVCVLCLSV